MYGVHCMYNYVCINVIVCMYVSGLWVLAGKPQLTTELVLLFLHENRFGMRIVPDQPLPPHAGDVIHPVLWLVRGRSPDYLDPSLA